MSVLLASESADGKHYIFQCPACGDNHSFTVPRWSFNGDMERPTFLPSLFYQSRGCHLYVTNGKIHYLLDCKHSLAGKIVDMVPYE